MKKLRILIISDNLIIADDIKTTLLREGYLITGVIRWGDDSMDIISLINPDLVIADLLLKDGMGLTDAAEMMNISFSAPVVFIAGEEIEKIMPEIGLSQFAGYLLKPFSNRELQNTIEITYKNFISSRKKEEPVNDTRDSGRSTDERGGEVTQKLTSAENTGIVRQLAELLSEINETFETYFFGKEVSLVILKQFGDIIYCNDNFSNMCGIPLSRITGENIITFIAPQDKYNFWKMLTCRAGTGGKSKLENKSTFFDCSLAGAQNELFRLYSCLEEIKDNQGESCLGMISVAIEAKDELKRLQEKIKVSSYEHGLIEGSPFLKGLAMALKDSEPLKQRSAPESYLKFRRSIFSLIGYAENLMNGIDYLSNKEIKNLAGKINAYLRIIYSLSQDDGLD